MGDSFNISSLGFCSVDNHNMDNFTIVKDMYTTSKLIPPRKLSFEGGDLSTLVDIGESKRLYSLVEEDLVPYPLMGETFLPRLDEHIGEGTHGHIYSLKGNNGVNAVKFQLHSYGSGVKFAPGNGTMDIPMNSFENEVSFQIYASANMISPIVYNAWFGKYSTIWGEEDHDVLIMDRLDKTIVDFVREDLSYVGGSRKVIDMIDEMHSMGIFHGDLHSGNIMTDFEGEPWVIDFGKSKVMPGSREARTWAILHDLQNLFLTVPKKSTLKKLIQEKAYVVAGSKQTRALGMDFDFCIYVD